MPLKYCNKDGEKILAGSFTAKDIADCICIHHGYKKEGATLAVNAIIKIMSDALAAGERLDIKGFGRFFIAKRNAHETFNNFTGERYVRDGFLVPYFISDPVFARKLDEACARGDKIIPLVQSTNVENRLDLKHTKENSKEYIAYRRKQHKEKQAQLSLNDGGESHGS